jgi:hypothetical protein
MTVQIINIGNQVNDGLGDNLRTAFEKVNANFSTLDSELSVTALNLGNGAGVFKDRQGGELRFKSLVSGRNIALDEFESSIEIRTINPDAFVRFHTDGGVVQADPPTIGNQGNLTIEGGSAPGQNLGIKDIVTSTDGTNHIRIRTVLPITEILTTVDFGPITGQIQNALQFAFASSNIDFGTVGIPSSYNLDLGEL